MAHKVYVHLHTHSEFSYNDGVPAVKAIVERARSLGMPAVALTDHNVMSGIPPFIDACQIAGIKPIVGVEVCVIDQEFPTGKVPPNALSHVTLWANGQTGYKNLMALSSLAFRYRQATGDGRDLPWLSMKDLKAHAEGVLASTGCLWRGAIIQAYRRHGASAALEQMRRYISIFPERYFVEIMPPEGQNDADFVSWLIQAADELSLPVIATNDVHYLDPEDHALHVALVGLRTNNPSEGAAAFSPLSAMKRDFCDADAMAERLGGVSERAFQGIAHFLSCIQEVSYRRNPVFHVNLDLPKDITPERYLRYIAAVGFEQRYRAPFLEDGRWVSEIRPPRADDVLFQCVPQAGVQPPSRPQLSPDDIEARRRRLNFEIDVIAKMGFCDYILAVHDILRFARRQQVWWNIRGSATGSLLLYCIGATRADPIANDLYFERFLNPDRISLPDIDIDFPDDRRAEMMRYIEEKYGSHSVAGVGAHSTLGARGAIRAAGRVLGLEAAADSLARRIESDDADIFSQVVNRDEYQIADLAARLKGRVHHIGTHAAGMLIANGALEEYAPTQIIASAAVRGGNDPKTPPPRRVSQYNMNYLEACGLVKMDLLGATMLRIMRQACDLIAQRHGVHLDLETIPVEDPLIFHGLRSGDVIGVFQIESDGMRHTLQKIAPKRFSDVVAAIALYRPGPKQYINNFAECANGRKSPSFIVPALRPILAETHGIIVYQEQLMRIAQVVAGYTLQEADQIRKAVGKKDEEKLKDHEHRFIEGAMQNGFSAEDAQKIWSDFVFFANYGFNKAHAVSYAMITCQSMWLKRRYPIEYFVALLNGECGQTERVGKIIEHCIAQRIPIAPPHVNISDAQATIQKDAQGREVIRLGLNFVKHVGASAAAIVKARERIGAFDSVQTLVGETHINRRVLVALKSIGALDGLAEAEMDSFNFGNGGTSTSADDATVLFKSVADAQKALIGAAIRPPRPPAQGEGAPRAAIARISTPPQVVSIASAKQNAAQSRSPVPVVARFVRYTPPNGKTPGIAEICDGHETLRCETPMRIAALAAKMLKSGMPCLMTLLYSPSNQAWVLQRCIPADQKQMSSALLPAHEQRAHISPSQSL